MYTRMYVAKRDNSYHELMCYDQVTRLTEGYKLNVVVVSNKIIQNYYHPTFQKLGWCVTKGAPHVHEIDIAGKPTGDGVLVAPHISKY